MKKRDVLIFLFDGYADSDISHVAIGISTSGQYQIKTVAMEMSPIKSMGGITVLPDTDFRPDADLMDIDLDTTAMLILPGGDWQCYGKVASLVFHCIEKQIPVAAIIGESALLAKFTGLPMITQREINGIEFAASIFSLLQLSHELPVRSHGDYFQSKKMVIC